MSKTKFIKNFIKSPGTIGAVMPSSKYLADLITSDIGLERATVIVELGPGTGVFSSVIVKKKMEEAVFFAIELNRELYDTFRHKYPYIKIYNNSAANLQNLMKKEGVETIDAIVCGLPWASFPPGLQDELLDAIVEALSPGGWFTTFAYLQGMMLPAGQRFRTRLKDHFSVVKTTRVEWKNFPPAFTYRCSKGE